MSRNGSGTYTLPSGNPVVSGTLIESAWANNTLSDIATALTDSLSRSGQGSMTAAFRAYDGTSTVPGIAWGSETTTGWYRAGAADMRLVVTGTEVMKYLSTGVSITGTLSGSGNFAINTDKFTVAASSGNTVVAGTLGVTGATTLSSTLGVTGNLAVNTDKFTVAAASGNTVVAGTLSVTGTSTFTGALTANGGVVGALTGNASTATALQNSRTIWGQSFNGTANVTGALTGVTDLTASGNGSFGGTLAVTGASTFSGQTVTLENSTAYYPQLINRNKTADANGSYLVLEKIRNTSVVQSGDVLGNLIFRGYDGSQYLQGAYINALVSATPGTNDMPTDLVFGTTPDGGAGPSERMRLNQAGNLGLGVTPSAWESGAKVMQFSTAGAGGTTGNTASIWARNDSIRLINGGYFDGAYKYSATGVGAAWFGIIGNSYQWNIAPSGTAGNAITFTQAMTLDASGNLGIGTTSPADRLSVSGGGIKVTNGNVAVTDGTTSFQMGVNNFATGYGMGTTSSTPLILATNGSERARIDSSGNLLVGTTSSQGSRAAFDASSDNAVWARTASATAAVNITWNSATSGDNIFETFFTDGGPSARGSISFNRGSGVVAYNTTSDYRAKDISGPVLDSGSVIDSVPVYMGKMKGATQERPMFIAHETPPYAHTGEKDAVDADGNPVYQQMDASALVPVLWAELQSVRKRLAALEAKA